MPRYERLRQQHRRAQRDVVDVPHLVDRGVVEQRRTIGSCIVDEVAHRKPARDIVRNATRGLHVGEVNRTEMQIRMLETRFGTLHRHHDSPGIEEPRGNGLADAGAGTCHHCKRLWLMGLDYR